MLHEKQKSAIELLLEGKNKSEVCKEINLSRRTLYNWLDDLEFKLELERLEASKKKEAQTTINSHVIKYISELEKIAFNSKSDKLRSEALMYLIDRTLGKPTSKTENITESNTETEERPVTWNDDDNVLELKSKNVKRY